MGDTRDAVIEQLEYELERGDVFALAEIRRLRGEVVRLRELLTADLVIRQQIEACCGPAGQVCPAHWDQLGEYWARQRAALGIEEATHG